MEGSHELPLKLLELGKTINDYDYCLPKFWNEPKYQEYFKNNNLSGRWTILDNGLYEGNVESEELLMEIINTINPSIFITPDSWNDADKTMNNYWRWREKSTTHSHIIGIRTELMVVLQGQTVYEVMKLHGDLINKGVRYIGINHSGIYYNEYKHYPEALRRYKFIQDLSSLNLLNNRVHYHLLGTNSILELGMYQDKFPQIKTYDTSNPVIYGLQGKTYEKDGIPATKIKEKLENYFSRDNINKCEDNIIDNVGFLKSYINIPLNKQI